MGKTKNGPFGRLDIYENNELYLTRWHLLHFERFGLYVHKIHKVDEDRDLHNHPWPFVAWIMRGGYTQNMDHGDGNWTRSTVGRWRLNVMRLPYFHRIVAMPVVTWSLVLRGRRRPEGWGFKTPDGFVPQDVYRADRDNSEKFGSDDVERTAENIVAAWRDGGQIFISGSRQGFRRLAYDRAREIANERFSDRCLACQYGDHEECWQLTKPGATCDCDHRSHRYGWSYPK